MVNPTDHSMWSELLDDKGRKRASIFYKAAFYDRDAFIRLNKRFSYTYIPEDDYKSDISSKERADGNWYGVIKDQGEVVYRTKPLKAPSYKEQDSLSRIAQEWLAANYPNYDDPTEYWD